VTQPAHHTSTNTTMGSLGPFELVLIFLAILLIFGAKRIPEIARGLGKGIKEFKAATNEISRELNVNEPANRIHPAPPSQGQAAPRQPEQQAETNQGAHPQ
jgi:sec-independent protein translocase protein TatA